MDKFMAKIDAIDKYLFLNVYLPNEQPPAPPVEK